MATPRLFRLKAEVIPRSEKQSAKHFPVARIWVDTGVFHLDQPYDYLIPEDLTEIITTGIRVQVPFGTREVEGIVIERKETADKSGRLRQISKVLSVHPIATQQSLALVLAVAQRWSTNPYDVFRLAIPPRVASVDKSFKSTELQPAGEGTSPKEQSFYAFKPYENPASQICAQITKAAKKGAVLVVAPDERDVNQIAHYLDAMGTSFLRVDSSLSRADRYANYLKALNTPDCIVLGARSAIFAPLSNLTTVIVYKESSHEHFERRSPGCNVRDIALLRRDLESIAVIFSGYVPSMELSALIDTRKLQYENHSFKLNAQSFSSEDGTLLPGRIFTNIRKALKTGAVLFMVPRKGYGNALLCAHCKNLAQCSCGGRLSIGYKNAPPTCTLCAKDFPDWICSWCDRKKPYIAGRGIERAAEEISRAFNGYPLILSYGDVIKSHIPHKPALVLATPGAAPMTENGYSAVVILEGLSFFSHPDIRAQERARELFFETAAMIEPKGEVLLSIPDDHPITSSIVKWNPGAMIRRELTERYEVALPPYVQSIVITCAMSEATIIVNGFKRAVSESRLPSSVKVFGPTPASKGESRIVIYVDIQDGERVRQFAHELQRRRSIAKKPLLTLRVDPYSF